MRPVARARYIRKIPNSNRTGDYPIIRYYSFAEYNNLSTVTSGFEACVVLGRREQPKNNVERFIFKRIVIESQKTAPYIYMALESLSPVLEINNTKSKFLTMNIFLIKMKKLNKIWSYNSFTL